ncbi:hypothetical protein GCM10023082_48260 [Streptomyces tremellae]|uniref:Glycerate kinase n=1 Tax=Streptomyces tremellae TaxID=1124239 RepID=A0ABP7FQX5_9ACTN
MRVVLGVGDEDLTGERVLDPFDEKVHGGLLLPGLAGTPGRGLLGGGGAVVAARRRLDTTDAAPAAEAVAR